MIFLSSKRETRHGGGETRGAASPSAGDQRRALAGDASDRIVYVCIIDDTLASGACRHSLFVSRHSRVRVLAHVAVLGADLYRIGTGHAQLVASMGGSGSAFVLQHAAVPGLAICDSWMRLGPAPTRSLTAARPRRRKMVVQAVGGSGAEGEAKIIVVGAVVKREGKFLMVERLKRSRGYFEFPGGKVEEGETEAAALARELKEELQVESTVTSNQPVAVGEDGPVRLKCYLAEINGEPMAPSDTLSVKWVGQDELRTLAVPPADQAVVRTLLELGEEPGGAGLSFA